MTRERWTEIKPLLDRALDLPIAERRFFVERKCGHDSELKLELESYLELEPEVETLFERPILDLIAGRPPEYRAGQRIGSFELEDELARGGMGVVYRAKRVEGGFEQTVAIKVLKRGFDTGDFVRSFRAEQQILANLEHPNIARLLDGGATEDGLPYLVMELVNGLRLDTYCRHHRLDLETRLELFAKICDAVHTAHQHMVVHCDLKPSNILVTPDGEPKLLDFGIAKVMRQDSDSTTRSFSMRLGTPPFASPEQQLTDGDITSSSDVYGLGAILYLLLTDEKPEKASKSVTPVQLPSKAPVPSPAKGNGSVGTVPTEPLLPIDRRELRGDLDAIVIRSMAHAPAERYDSVAALGEDLDRHRRHLPVHAQTYTWAYALRLFAARRQLELWIAAGIVGLIVIVNVLWFGYQERLETARAEEMVSTSLELLEIFVPTADESIDDATRTAFQNLLDTPTLAATEQQAYLYDRLGRYLMRNDRLDEARPFLEKALELRQSGDQAIDEDQAASFNNLGLALEKQGRLDSAAQLMKLADGLYRQHPDWSRGEALDILHNRANVERKRDNSEGAIALYLEALEGRRAHYGKQSREVARTLNNLGSLYLRENKLAEAEPYLEEGVAIREVLYGSDHPNVATGLIGLAILREAQGRVEEAVEIFRRALEIRRARLGEDSPSTARARSALSFALLGREGSGDLAEAKRELERAVAVLEIEGQTSPEAGLVARRNLADVLLRLGDTDAASELLETVDAHSEDWSPANAWRVADVDNLRGAVALEQGRIEDAERLFDGTLVTIETAKGEDSRYAEEARERLEGFQDTTENTELETR